MEDYKEIHRKPIQPHVKAGDAVFVASVEVTGQFEVAGIWVHHPWHDKDFQVSLKSSNDDSERIIADLNQSQIYKTI